MDFKTTFVITGWLSSNEPRVHQLIFACVLLFKSKILANPQFISTNKIIN